MGLRELALGQSGGFRSPLFLTFGASRNWTVPFDMDVFVCAIGGFAVGGVVLGVGNASGAGAPGCAIKRTKLSAGTILTMTIGAPGTPASLTNNGAVNGGSGGTTTLTGGGLNLAANGGGGGLAINNLQTAVSGGPGGTASGGDFNFTGGRGGNLSAIQSGYTNSVRATGAGALNLLGLNDCNGGDLTNLTLTNGSAQATGGGSCFASGASSAATTSVSTIGGDTSLLAGLVTAFPVPLGRPLLGLTTVGQRGFSGNPGGNFAGSDGYSATGTISAYAAGLFGGSGGGASWGGSVSNNASYGSTGASAASSNSSTAATGRNGVIVLEILS